MKFKINDFNKTYTIKIDIVDTVIKHLKKQNLKPDVAYTYNPISGYLKITLYNVLEFADEYKLIFPVHWNYANNTPYVDSYVFATDKIIDNLLNI